MALLDKAETDEPQQHSPYQASEWRIDVQVLSRASENTQAASEQWCKYIQLSPGVRAVFPIRDHSKPVSAESGGLTD